MRPGPLRPRIPIVLAVCLVAALLLSSGCLLRTLRKQQQREAVMCLLEGTVTTEHPSSAPLVVVILRREGESFAIFDSFTRETAGRWFFFAGPGSYRLAAFEDKNADLVYQPGEPARRAMTGLVYELTPGQRQQNIELVIPPGGRADVQGPVDILTELRARSAHHQEARSLGQLSIKGEIVGLDDSRFDPEKARSGLWQRIDFLYEVGPGIYFLEAYDPDKIPVLFVHGVLGSPREFEKIAERLDRERFQPWFYYYPSGFHLDDISSHLSQLVAELHVRHHFDDLFVVAHSMGGLVARSFILKHHEQSERDYVKLFISISSPWGGVAQARFGVEHAPENVPLPPSWHDVASGSPFLDGLFFEEPATREIRRRLPPVVGYHLLFGYKKAGRGAAGDGVLTLSSMLRVEAQREALTRYGIDDHHTGILRNPETFAAFNEILAAAAP
jgi:pimeloyl-ACP methyl ester carboxylesterase